MDLDIETVGFIALGVAVLVILVQRATKKRHAIDVREALEGFRCDPSLKEKDFHRALKMHLEGVLDVSLLRKIIIDAQIPRTTTEIDLHIDYGKVDYLVTVKKGISAQKVKTLAGEVQEIYKYWPKDADRTARVVVMLYGDLGAKAGDDHIGKVIELTHATDAGREDMHLEFVFTAPIAGSDSKRRVRSKLPNQHRRGRSC